ncbi:arylsulfatase [bacterium]|nr:arylsulfatase [bacterium]
MDPSRRAFLKSAGLGGLALAMGPSLRAAGRGGKPDIVVIIGDDIGYSDFGCYGGEIETPNIDSLAAKGVRFTQFHTENMCAPTRTSLMTGRYHIRGFANPGSVSLAEALSAGGYRTCMSGKWHLAGAPTRRGFDSFFGTPLGCGSFFAPLKLMRGEKSAEAECKRPDFYYTDAISDNAVKDIRETADDQPLFLYVAYTAAHWPLHALPEDMAKYEGRYRMGWDKLREQRYARMKKLGVIEPHTPLSPRHPNAPAWNKEEHPAWQQRRMEVYAAQIDRMDKGIGRILGALGAAGRLENTLVMMLVDNGGCHVEYGANRKGSFLNERTRDGRPMVVGNRPDVMPGPEETWQSYGYGWANASNTPFRLFKQFDHQGGICVPLIVQWPKTIAQGGQITRQVCHVIDLMPTALDAAGLEPPATHAGRKLAPLDGKSMLPILHGKTREPHEALFWRFAHGRAVRQGKWKLVREDRKAWELYDLDADPAELTDLAGTHPDRAADLSARWDAWQKAAAPRGKKKRK